MKFIRSILYFSISIFIFSCSTSKPIPNYLQQVNDSTGKGIVRIPEFRIQKNDLLSIQVFSSATKPEVDQLYNLPTPANTGNAQTPVIAGFLVDINGNIEYPKLGTFHAEGLTKDSLASEIRRKLIEPVQLLENPVVIIRFLNLKVTVLGEVNTQGLVNIPGERITILEAIGLAGGITDFGLKNSVKVMRETDGQREIGVVDLSSKELFSSQYYNLKQGDVVLVDPTPKKAKKAEQDAVLARVSFGLSIITAIALVYNIFK
jgi:polysaccharide export outer membrane protein